MRAVKVYEYCVNGFIKGRINAFNKRQVKWHCKSLAEIFCPTKGVETIKIARVKE